MRSFFELVQGDRRLRLAATLAAAVLTLGACGGGGDDAGDEGASEESTTSAPPRHRQHVRDDHRRSLKLRRVPDGA